MADILASDVAVSFVVLLEHRQESIALLGRLAVHQLAHDRIVGGELIGAGI